MSKSDGRSRLTEAAEALQAELRRFEETAERVRTATFDSQKALERAAGWFKDVSDIDERMGEKVRELIAAISEVRERQQAQAEMITQRAQELQARTEAFQTLVQRYAGLGTDAASLNALVQEVHRGRQSGAPETEAEANAKISQVAEGAERLAAEAQKVTQEAEAAGFLDIARQADSLRQQLLSARNKLGLLQERVPRA